MLGNAPCLDSCHKQFWTGNASQKLGQAKLKIESMNTFSFSREFFSFHKFVSLLFFLFLLITGFNLWWSDRMWIVISIFMDLLRLALWLSMWSTLEKVA